MMSLPPAASALLAYGSTAAVLLERCSSTVGGTLTNCTELMGRGRPSTRSSKSAAVRPVTG